MKEVIWNVSDSTNFDGDSRDTDEDQYEKRNVISEKHERSANKNIKFRANAKRWLTKKKFGV